MSNCAKLEDTNLCLNSGDKWTDSLNNISYMVSKLGLEQNCPEGPSIIPLDGVKGNDDDDVYKIIYKPMMGLGNIGAIKREVDQIIDEMANIANSLNPNPGFVKIKKPGTNECVNVYSHDYYNHKNVVKQCTEGFTNLENDNKKKIYKLYLLTFGSIIIFLMYKLLSKK